MILMKIYPSSRTIMTKEIIFPSGKRIVLGQHGMSYYMVTNKEELEFLSKQRDIQLVKPEYKDVIKFIEELPELPIVGTHVEEPKVFDPAHAEEELLKEELIKRGYSVNKVSGDSDSSFFAQSISDTTLISEFVRRSKINPDLLKAVGISGDETIKETLDISNMSESELKVLMYDLGYVGLRKRG